jgi:hypothetical protein
MCIGTFFLLVPAINIESSIVSTQYLKSCACTEQIHTVFPAIIPQTIVFVQHLHCIRIISNLGTILKYTGGCQLVRYKYCAILYRGITHDQILVSSGGPETCIVSGT